MTDPKRTESEDGESRAVRDLLRRSLTEGHPSEVPDLVAGVQRRIRKRSKGKFFGDGWSLTQHRASYALIALTTLLLACLAYYALGPMDIRAP